MKKEYSCKLISYIVWIYIFNIHPSFLDAHRYANSLYIFDKNNYFYLSLEWLRYSKLNRTLFLLQKNRHFNKISLNYEYNKVKRFS